MELDADVIIIGAGLAGLTAAQYFKERGISHLILESRNRIGGRVITRYLNIDGHEVAIDLGASWVHGIKENPLITLLSQIKQGKLDLLSENEVTYENESKLFEELQLLPTSEDNFWMSTDSANEVLFDWNQKVEVTEEFLKKYQRLFQEIKELAQTTTDRTYSLRKGIQQTDMWKQISKGNEVERKLLNWFLYKIEVWMSSNLDDITLSEFAADFGNYGEFAGSHCVSKEGLGKVVSFLAKGLNIRLNHQVIKVDTSNEQIISVYTKDKPAFRCKYILCTIPLGVLKAMSKELFLPSLSSKKLDSLDKLKMGAYGKVVLHFERPFWDEYIQGKQAFIGCISNDPTKYFSLFLNYNKLKGVPIVMTFMIDEFARKMETLPEKDVIQLAVDSFLRMFPKVANPKLKNAFVTRWNTDPHSMGAYSYLPLGCHEDDVNELMNPEANNRLFFAGEAAEFDYQGSLHGSYLTGLSQARRLADTLLSRKSNL